MIEKYVDAAELRRLLSSLFVILGAILLAGLFASILVPGLRNANKPEVPTPVNPVVGEPGWLDPTEFPPQRAREIPPVDARTLINSSPELTARGKDLFARNCVPCHGDLGRGDGPASATMSPRPRNFASPDGWTNGHDLPAIFKTLSTGVLGTSMAAFDYLSKSDRMALAHYVQDLGAFPHGTGSAQAVEALSKELATPGEKTANKIPVSMAMAKLEEEFSASPPVPTEEDHSPGAELLRQVVTDPARAAQTLAGSPSWRQGPKELAASIVPGTPGNGFSARAATLSPSEWQTLHTELLKRVGHQM
jgi:mono/diheme cytochrome c family protein